MKIRTPEEIKIIQAKYREKLIENRGGIEKHREYINMASKRSYYRKRLDVISKENEQNIEQCINAQEIEQQKRDERMNELNNLKLQLQTINKNKRKAKKDNNNLIIIKDIMLELIKKDDDNLIIVKDIIKELIKKVDNI